MADNNTHRIPKTGATGSYPGVTGSYKPHSAYPESSGTGLSKSAPVGNRAQSVRNSGKKPEPEKVGFDFKLWFSKENNKMFLRQLRYYGLIVVAALILTFCIINLSNDVFAFIKPDESVIVTIEQVGGTAAIAKALKKAGVIEHPLLFRLYSKLKKADSKFQYGDYTLNSNLGYDQIISKLKKSSAQAESYTFTIDQGATQDDIVSSLTSAKRVTSEKIENALNEYDYSDFDFVGDLPDRRCRLEGYLPAGDYEFYVGESAVSMVSKMLTRFTETVLTDENKSLIKASGMSVDDVVTLASLIQSECTDAGEYKHVCRVLLNRLAKDDGLLQLTSTINYVLATKKTVFTVDDKKTDSEYNTYIYAGLPTGPVCNPSAAAITAALSPESGSDMYFISDGDKTYYATDLAAHQANLKKASDSAKGTDTIR